MVNSILLPGSPDKCAAPMRKLVFSKLGLFIIPYSEIQSVLLCHLGRGSMGTLCSMFNVFLQRAFAGAV